MAGSRRGSGSRGRSGEWIPIKAKKPGRCDLCGRTFTVGTRIRYDPKAYRVRCLGECMTVRSRSETTPKPESPKHISARPQWEGEYVVLFDRDDYWFRKCVVCGRQLAGAPGRVGLAKKRGVCPACEERTPEERVEQLKEAALAADRAHYRASHPPPN